MSEIHPKRASRANHRYAFFRNWLKDPFHVASVAPSGKSFARLMASGLGSGSRVMELGAGTGTITQAILQAGVRPADLYLVELNEDFARILKGRFPDAHVLHASADALLPSLDHLRGSIDCVVSGLPILWFHRTKKARILADAFRLLHPAGSFHQMTYWGRPPVGSQLLLGLDLQASLLGFTPWNLPPAFAFRFEKAAATRPLRASHRVRPPRREYAELIVAPEK